MENLPKFLLCENPINEDLKEFILHTEEPKFLTKIIFHDNKKVQEKFISNELELFEKGEILFAYKGKSEFNGEYFSILPIEYYTEINSTIKDKEKLEHIIKEMTEWFCKYLEWEEKLDD